MSEATRPGLAVRVAKPLLKLTGGVMASLGIGLFLLGAIVSALAYGPVYSAFCELDDEGVCQGSEAPFDLMFFAGVLVAASSLLFVPVGFVHFATVRRQRRRENSAAPRAAALDSWRMARQISAAQHDAFSRRLATIANGDHPAQVVRHAGALLAAFMLGVAVLGIAVFGATGIVWMDENWCRQSSTVRRS